MPGVVELHSSQRSYAASDIVDRLNPLVKLGFRLKATYDRRWTDKNSSFDSMA